MQTCFCVSISLVEISCNKMQLSVDFDMFSYLCSIIFGLIFQIINLKMFVTLFHLIQNVFVIKEKYLILFSESVSSIVEGSYNNGQKTKIIYGVFTTPENAIGGNAICAFQISDVLDTFEGPFKEQETANSNWLPVRDMKVRAVEQMKMVQHQSFS